MPHSGRAHRDKLMRRGRKGRPYRRGRAHLMATKADSCAYCGHGGANELGHRIDVVDAPKLAGDPRNWMRVHGTSARCPVCPDPAGKYAGRACNQEANRGKRRNALPRKAMSAQSTRDSARYVRTDLRHTLSGNPALGGESDAW